jgi:hypothetical protein
MTSEVGVERSQSRLTPSTINSNSQISERRTAFVTYLVALLLGLAITAYMFPRRAIFAADIRVRPVYQYDAAMNVYGQRYFTKDPWRWPPFLVKKLGTPDGTNIALMDGIPLIELVVKLFRHFLPPDFHSVYLWLALCWVAQPMAAVFALRSAGEPRLLPNLAVAVIAASMPTLLFRFAHSALCSHFLILIALGLYFRITQSAKLGTILGAGALMLAALLVNPYIMEMVIAVLVAAPLTLLIRRDRSWTSITAGIGAGVAITAVVALLLGYGGTVPMGGFGTYSMNLLSPIYPSNAFSGQFVDATGGQYEGYQYLGVGVILLLLVADFCLSMQERLRLLRRHGGLVLACIVLTLLALSTKVYAGHRLLLDLPSPSWLLQLRASGRLFWPVAYTAIIVGTVIVSRKLPAPRAFVLLFVLATLQYVESMPMRREVRRVIRSRPGYTIDTALFRSLLADHSKLTVWPKFGCEADPRTPEFSDLYLLASEVAIPVNMTYVGRFTKWPNCTLSEFPISVGANELWVFVPRWNPAIVISVVDWHSICRQSSVLVVCAQDLRGRTDLPLPTVPTLPLGKTLSTAADGAGNQWLASGWYASEPWGIWSHGATAYLAANFDKPLDRGLVLRVWASGLAVRPSTTQRVTVLANGHPIATWDVKEGVESEYSAAIPPPSPPAQSVFIEFHVDHPISPRQQGLAPDPRELGFGLSAFRFDEPKEDGTSRLAWAR